MAFDEFLDKAKNLPNDPKVKGKLNSDKAEQIADSVLDKAAEVVESLTGGKHSGTIKKARDTADNAIGSERDQSGGTSRGDDVRRNSDLEVDQGSAGNR